RWPQDRVVQPALLQAPLDRSFGISKRKVAVDMAGKRNENEGLSVCCFGRIDEVFLSAGVDSFHRIAILTRDHHRGGRNDGVNPSTCVLERLRVLEIAVNEIDAKAIEVCDPLRTSRGTNQRTNGMTGRPELATDLVSQADRACGSNHQVHVLRAERYMDDLNTAPMIRRIRTRGVKRVNSTNNAADAPTIRTVLPEADASRAVRATVSGRSAGRRCF